MKLTKIGKVGIDGGSIVMVDPCMANLISMESWKGFYRQISFPSSVEVQTGDGDYSVYVIGDDANFPDGILIVLDDGLIDKIQEKAGSDD